MSATVQGPRGIALLPLPVPDDHNRLCVVVSDLHCTDGTVGNQSGEEPDWVQFFQQVEQACQVENGWMNELYIVLNGDIVDLIRSAAWTQAGVFPWNRDDARFTTIVGDIMAGIVQQHANPNGLGGRHGFFVLLKRAVAALQTRGIRVHLIPIVGNHDKELLVAPAARALFYRECLGLSDADLAGDYRSWIEDMYGAATPPGETPWLPFYFADRGFRLFATHGQWRDGSNARPCGGWTVAHGWTPAAWRAIGYAPFVQPCFGDTVAAGLLSGFIWRVGSQLGNEPTAVRLRRILDEMDLYRPATAGLVRILQEARKLSRRGGHEEKVALICNTFRDSLTGWLRHATTWQSAPLRIRCFLPLLWLLARLHWEWVTLWIMQLMAKVQEPEASIDEATLLTLPAFQRAYRECGFAIHSEGHTHVALEADLQFEDPALQTNYTYINTGAWRDRIVKKDNYGYRRRGIGRGLFVFDLVEAPPKDGQAQLCGRQLRFYVRDVCSWGDHLDRLDNPRMTSAKPGSSSAP